MLLGRGSGGPKLSSWRRDASKQFGMYFARRSGVVEPQDEAEDNDKTDGARALRGTATHIAAAAGSPQPTVVDAPIPDADIPGEPGAAAAAQQVFLEMVPAPAKYADALVRLRARAVGH